MTTENTPIAEDAEVVVHWRPGCGFCARLLGAIDDAGLVHQRVNIWEDEAGAAWVRSVADGNEVVPTVRIGDLAMVNPRPRELFAAVLEAVPGALPDDFEVPGPSRLERLVSRERSTGE